MTMSSEVEKGKNKRKAPKKDERPKSEVVFTRAVYEYNVKLMSEDGEVLYIVSKIVIGTDTSYDVVRRSASRDIPIGAFKVSAGAVSSTSAPNPKFASLLSSVASIFCNLSDTRTRSEKLRDREQPEKAMQRRLEGRGQERLPAVEG